MSNAVVQDASDQLFPGTRYGFLPTSTKRQNKVPGEDSKMVNFPHHGPNEKYNKGHTSQ